MLLNRRSFKSATLCSSTSHHHHHHHTTTRQTSLKLPRRFRLSFFTALLRFLLLRFILHVPQMKLFSPLRSKSLALRAPLIGSLFSSLDALMARFLMSLELLPCQFLRPRQTIANSWSDARRSRRERYTSLNGALFHRGPAALPR